MGRLTVVNNQWGDTEGRSVPKGLLYSYEVGSNTPKALYSDAALTQALANPYESDGAGRLGNVFGASGGYRIEWRNAEDAVLWELDDYYPPVDGTDIINLENDIQANSEALVENTAPYTSTNTGDDYELSIAGGFDAPAQYREGQIIRWTPNTTNVGGSPSVDVEGLGAVGLRSYDGSTLIADNFLQTDREYSFRYTGSIFKLVLISGQQQTANIEDDAVTIDKMAAGTAGKVISYDSSGDPALSSEIYRQWYKFGDSGQLTSGSSYAFTGIPDNATKIEIIGTTLQVDTADANIELQAGYGATPTYLTAVGDYIGRQTFTSSATDGGTSWDTFADNGIIDSGNNTASVRITLDKINDGSDTWMIHSYGGRQSGNNVVTTAGGRINGASLVSALSAIQLSVSGNAFTDGYLTCYVYGNKDI